METDELELDLDNIEVNAEKKDKVRNRFEQLSTKVITVGKEKDAEAEARKKAEAERDNMAKELDFHKGFSTHLAKYPQASGLQEKILEKVKSGYDVEDAMVAVLAKEGKLNQQTTEPEPQYQPQYQAEGGSSQTIIPGNKSPDNMSTEEKFNALKEADKSGDLARALLGQ